MPRGRQGADPNLSRKLMAICMSFRTTNLSGVSGSSTEHLAGAVVLHTQSGNGPSAHCAKV